MDRFFFSLSTGSLWLRRTTDDGDDIPHAPGILGLRFRSHNLSTASTHRDSFSCDSRHRNPQAAQRRMSANVLALSWWTRVANVSSRPTAPVLHRSLVSVLFDAPGWFLSWFDGRSRPWLLLNTPRGWYGFSAPVLRQLHCASFSSSPSSSSSWPSSGGGWPDSGPAQTDS